MDWYVSFLISIASIAGTVQGFHSQGRCLSRGLLCATAKCERTFQFVPYGSTFDLKTKKSICVDGLVQGTDLHLSHWSGNKTPKHYLSDLSLECAFKFIEMEQENSEWKDAVVVNNHFDTDGLLSAWALLEPEKALAHKDKMLAAAAAGDFDEWGVSDRGLQLNFAILNMAKSASAEDGDAYKLILPEVADLLSNINKREDLWGEDMARLREFDDQWADDIIQGYRVIDDKVIPESPARCCIIFKCQNSLRTEAEAAHQAVKRLFVPCPFASMRPRLVVADASRPQSRFSHAAGLIGDIGVPGPRRRPLRPSPIRFPTPAPRSRAL